MALACAVASVALPLPALAQADDDAITVTGTGLAPPPGDAAYAVATIDRDRLIASASGRIEDVLRDVAGIAAFRRSDSRSASPTSQGATLRGIGGNASSRVLLLLDGVPQADPFGGWIAFPAYLPDALGQVRVTRGGGSGYAGPGALAGTIELTSADGAILDPLAVSVAGGSRGAFDATAMAVLERGSGFASIAAHYARGDGFVPIVAGQRGPADRAAPYESMSLNTRAVIAMGDTMELQASMSGFVDRRDRGIAFTAIRSEGADASLRIVGRGAWGWSLLGYLQTRAFASGFASVDATRSTATATLDQYRVPSTGIGGRIELSPPVGGGITLRIGGDVRRVSGETREFYSFVAGAATRRRVAGGESMTGGGFVDASVERGALTLSLGGRIDRWTITDGRLAERTLATGAVLTDARFAERSGWEPTGRAGLAWRVGERLALRAAGYRGWRLPTLNELYRPFRAGADATAANADLSPERLTGAEVGADVMLGTRGTLRTTLFASRLTDAIANVTLGSGPGVFPGVGFVGAGGAYRQRRNIDAVDARGVEVDGQWRKRDWSFGASWAYSDSRIRASGVAAALDGLRPAQTATHQGSATLGWSRGDWAAGITARYVAAQFEDDLNRRSLAPATTLDVRVAVPLARRWLVELRAENAFDARIAAAIGADGVIERATPRTLWLGLRYRLRQGD